MAEDLHLLNERQQRPRMDGECRVGTLRQACLLGLLKLGDPNIHHLFEFRADQVTEGGVLSRVGLEDAIAKSFTKIGELGWVCECAERYHSLLPVGQIGIVDDIP